ncbi:uncharacterized protein LOC128455302 isoform X1 [Pleuronectes platessa]|uniref:uncharacterized protein LOC128455302 isoform X1 n=2 Tax=Pleuronectes platessa TaxID=8262 RepID=UPI00232A29CC|nr:uncharacterized protein LOC128455302 isoform X1 [Pleuronectes platessa]
MKLQIQGAASTPGSLFCVDRGSNLSPLPLSNLPQSCGYTIRSTRRDFVLVAPYDGCFVAHEEDSYVLPLRWCGLPVRMSCPVMKPSAPNPPMVTCHSEGMVVKTDWMISAAKIIVKLNDVWEPLLSASAKCGFVIVVLPDGVAISARYAPCLKKRDGLYTLELYGDGETKISCPSLSATEPELTKSPPNYPGPQTEVPSKGVHHLTPSHSSGSPPYQTFAKNQEAPHKKPDEGPKDIARPQMPDYPSYPHFFYPYPDPKPVTTAQPLSSPLTKTSEVQSKQTLLPSNLPMAPEGQMPQKFLPFYVWPSQPLQLPVEKETRVDSSATQPPKVKVEDPFYHYPYYFNPVQMLENPTTQSPVTKPPPGKFPEYVPSGTTQKPQEPTSSKPENHEYKPQPLTPVAQEPRRQMYQPFYPTPFYTPLWPQGPYQPQMPPTKLTPTLAPKGQLNPGTSHPQIPGKLSTSKPPSAPQSKVPSQPEAPAAKVQQQVYPFVNPSKGKVYDPFNPYYPQQPQQITLPATTSTPRPQPIQEPIYGGNVHQGPQPGSPYMPPFYCPQSCPSGIYNCCPQFAFHQHLHQYVPAGLGSQNAPLVYPAMPYLSSLGYSSSGRGLGDPAPELTEETTQVSATTLQQALPPQNEQLPYLLPPDGNNAVPVVSVPINQRPNYPYFVPNMYPPQSQSAVNYNAPSGPQPPGNWQGNPYYIQPPQSQMSQLLPFGAQYLQHLANQQREPRATELKPSNVNHSDSEEPMRAKVKSVADRYLVPNPVLQDARAPSANSSQQFLSALKKSTTHDQIIQTDARSKSYVLLQQGPPGRERNSKTEELLADTTLQSQNLKPHNRYSNPQQDNPPFGSAMDGSHFAPLPRDSFNTPHINPEVLEKMWQLGRTFGYNQRIPSPAPGEEFQGRRSAADQRDWNYAPREEEHQN